MLNVCAKFHEDWTCTLQEMTTSITNQQTRLITIPPRVCKHLSAVYVA